MTLISRLRFAFSKWSACGPRSRSLVSRVFLFGGVCLVTNREFLVCSLCGATFRLRFSSETAFSKRDIVTNFHWYFSIKQNYIKIFSSTCTNTYGFSSRNLISKKRSMSNPPRARRFSGSFIASKALHTRTKSILFTRSSIRDDTIESGRRTIYRSSVNILCRNQS
jgi:hypothetical protein